MGANYACRSCDAVFTKGEHLKRHERAHTGEKPFPCPICTKAFARSDVLTKHLRYHERKHGRTVPKEQAGDASEEYTTPSDQNQSPKLDITQTSPSSHSSPNTNTSTKPSPHQYHVSPNMSISRPYQSSLPPMQAPYPPQLNPNPSSNPQSASSPYPYPQTYPQNLPPNVPPQAFSPNMAHFSPNRYPYVNMTASAPIYASQSMQPGMQPAMPMSTQISVPVQMGQTPIDTNYILPELGDLELFDQYLKNLPNFIDAKSTIESTIVPQLDSEDARVDPAAGASISADSREKLWAISRIWPSRPIADDTAERSMSIVNRSSSSLPERIASGLMHTPEHKVFDMPSPGFVSASIALYFRHFHPSHPLLHKPTFNPSNTFPLLLSAMCAVGARYTGSPDAVKFSEAIWERTAERILAETRITEGNVLELMQATYIAQSYGLLAGGPRMLQTSIVLHNSLVARAKRRMFFDQLDTDAQHIEDTSMEGWIGWTQREMHRRFALSLFFQDGCFHSITRTQAPLLSLSTINVSLPSSSHLFDATYEEWLTRPKEETLPIRSVISNLYAGKPMDGPYFYDAVDLMVMACTIYSQIRFRVLAAVPTDDGAPIAGGDVASAGALLAWRRFYNLPPDNDPFHSNVIFNILHIFMLTDLDYVEMACGRDGPDKANTAMRLLQKQWANTPQARRAALHAAQILRYLTVGSARRTAAYHMWTATFHAALVLQVYGWTCHDSGKVYLLTDEIDWQQVDVHGVNGEIRDIPDPYWAVDFILHGGHATIADYGPLSMVSCRAQVQVDVAANVKTLGAGAWNTGNVLADILNLITSVDTDSSTRRQ